MKAGSKDNSGAMICLPIASTVIENSSIVTQNDAAGVDAMLSRAASGARLARPECGASFALPESTASLSRTWSAANVSLFASTTRRVRPGSGASLSLPESRIWLIVWKLWAEPRHVFAWGL